MSSKTAILSTLILSLVIMLTRCQAIGNAPPSCTGAFLNSTGGVLSDAQIQQALDSAKNYIATESFALNQLSCMRGGPNCLHYLPPDPRALSLNLCCIQVSVDSGTSYCALSNRTNHVVLFPQNNCPPAQAVLVYELEGIILAQLGYDISDW